MVGPDEVSCGERRLAHGDSIRRAPEDLMLKLAAHWPSAKAFAASHNPILGLQLLAARWPSAKANAASHNPILGLRS
jgi:hypothetical protein